MHNIYLDVMLPVNSIHKIKRTKRINPFCCSYGICTISILKQTGLMCGFKHHIRFIVFFFFKNYALLLCPIIIAVMLTVPLELKLKLATYVCILRLRKDINNIMLLSLNCYVNKKIWICKH